MRSQVWRALARAIVIVALVASPLAAVAHAAESAAACGSAPLTEVERRLILGTGAQGGEAATAALDDPALKARLLRYANVELGLRVRPSAVDRMWSIQPPRRDVASEFEAARAAGRLAAWLSALPPPHEPYRRLVVEGCRYAGIVERGGWASMPQGPVLRAGDVDPAVGRLRSRLALEGYRLQAAGAPERLDADLDRALRAFQRRHDLEEDGVLGPATRAALNVPADRRLQQIQANLERWRWLPHDLPADRLEVDAGAAEATLFLAGAANLHMRVIVGDPRHRTPMFTSQLEAVVFNPPWNVPASIARNEILPKLARDPGYLKRNGFVRTAQGLQQRPGPNNALGRLKFDLPSPFGVYLHDTPGRSAFARRVRTLSHGCMRLEKPVELAQILLSRQGWDRAGIDAAIAAGKTQRVALQRPVPLYVVYRTAAVDADGWAVFRPDPYGWDAKLMNALGGARLAQAAPPAATECAVFEGAAMDYPRKL